MSVFRARFAEVVDNTLQSQWILRDDQECKILKWLIHYLKEKNLVFAKEKARVLLLKTSCQIYVRCENNKRNTAQFFQLTLLAFY